MSKLETVNYSQSGHVATITMNRPDALNSFNTQLRLDLSAAIERANTDSSVRVVVLGGEGRGFSAGHDLADGLGNHPTIEQTILKEYKPLLKAIDGSDKLFISAIKGAAAGIGAAVAMTCDLIVMADDGYFFLAFAGIGLVVDGGASYHLVRKLGYKKAMEIVVEAQKVPAQECLSLGLINKLVPADELMSAAQGWAERLAEGAPLAQKYNKQLLKRAQEADLDAMIDLEASTQNITIATEDHETARKAFFNKEKPVFVGK